MDAEKKLSTKELIANTLEELLNTKSVYQISVSEIIGKCNLSRQTFYRHFEDIYDLLAWLFYYTNDSFNVYDEARDFEAAAVYSFSLMARRSKLFKRLFLDDKDNLFLRRLLQDRLKRGARIIGSKNLNEEIQFALEFYWIGFFHMLIRWLNTGMKESPEKMAQFVTNCIPDILKKYYH